MRSLKDILMDWILSSYTEDHFAVCREYVLKKRRIGELSAVDASALLFAIQGLERAEDRLVSRPPLVFKWQREEVAVG